MKLTKIHIDRFGKLEDYTLTCKSGMNLLCAENGWGKTTLAVFLKAMFYGLPVSRKNICENEQKKYLPWGGGHYGGYLEFEVGDKSYRIERGFDASEKSLRVIDLATGLDTSVFGENPGETLFGINAEGFERCIFLSQKHLRSTDGVSGLNAKLGSLLENVDDAGSFDTASARLEEAKKEYDKTGRRGKIAKLEDELSKKELDLENLKKEELALAEWRRDKKECAEKLAALEKQMKENRAAAGLSKDYAHFREETAKLESALAILEQKKAESEARIGGSVPDEETLSEMRNACLDLREKRAKLQAQEEAFDKTYYAELRQKYEHYVPTESDLKSAFELSEKIRSLEACERLKQEPSGSPAPTAATVKETARAMRLLEENQILEKEVQDTQTLRAEKKSGYLLPILLCALGLSSIPIALFVTPVLFLLSALFIGVSVIFFLRASRKKAECASIDEKIDSLRQRIEENNRSVDLLLRMFGLPTDGNREMTLRRFAETLAKREEAEKNGKESLEAIGLELAQCKETLSCAMGGLGKSLLSGVTVADLRRELHDLSELERAKLSVIARRADLSKAEQKLKSVLPPSDLSPEEAVERLRADTEVYRHLEAEYREKQTELQTLLQKNPIRDGDLPADWDTLSADAEEMEKKAERLREHLRAIDLQSAGAEAETERVPELIADCERLREELEESTHRLEILTKTQKILEEAKTNLSVRYLLGMRKDFKDFLAKLTGTDTDSIIDTNLEVKLEGGGSMRSAELFSSGWQDITRFCMALSLIKSLFKDGEMPFLILDDPFVNLDDDRYQAVWQMLGKLAEDYQIFYFVCRKTSDLSIGAKQ